jgi:Tol biopolymer transport system component
MRPLALSPDGRSIVYVDYDRAGDLFLHDLATGADRRLTQAGDKASANDDGAAVSADSTLLAYGWTTAEGLGELRVVDLRGSGTPTPRRLLADKSIGYMGPLGWTPDGQWIAALVDRNGTNQIALISTTDASVRVIKSANIQVFNIGWGFVSPDGRYIAIDGSGRSTQGRDIFVLDITSEQETPVVVHPGNDRLLGWSGDGTRLLFASNRTASNALFVQPLTDGRTAGEPALITADVGPLFPVGVTSNGSLYFSFNYRGTSDVTVRPFEFGAGATPSTPKEGALPNFGASHRSPEWSPDGRDLAYVVERGAGVGETSLAIRSVATDQVQEVRLQLARVEWLRWASDGRSFVVSTQNFRGLSGLWRVDRETAEVSAVAPGTFAARPQDAPGAGNRFHGWSPDARKVYFQRALPIEQGTVLFERDVASGQERELFRETGPGPYYSPRLSPDGRTLYYRKGQGIATEASSSEAAFIARDLESGAETELIRGRVGSPALSPDGRYIATSLFDLSTQSRSIVLIPATGGAARVLMRTPLPASFSTTNWQNMQSLLWAADSRSLMFSALDQPTSAERWAHWWVSVEDREAPRRTSLTGNLADVRVHPGGRRIAMGVAHPPTTSEVWMLEGAFRGAVTRR